MVGDEPKLGSDYRGGRAELEVDPLAQQPLDEAALDAHADEQLFHVRAVHFEHQRPLEEPREDRAGAAERHVALHDDIGPRLGRAPRVAQPEDGPRLAEPDHLRAAHVHLAPGLRLGQAVPVAAYER